MSIQNFTTWCRKRFGNGGKANKMETAVVVGDDFLNFLSCVDTDCRTEIDDIELAASITTIVSSNGKIGIIMKVEFRKPHRAFLNKFSRSHLVA
ncbi:hypothetical protein JTB14_009914 [Gonioctena quinquepunctata]|nr:hypothetical protein JTB14_009914 [Gonioctena quinquepunctata]